MCVVWLAVFGFKDVIKIGYGSSMFGGTDHSGSRIKLPSRDSPMFQQAVDAVLRL